MPGASAATVLTIFITLSAHYNDAKTSGSVDDSYISGGSWQPRIAHGSVNPSTRFFVSATSGNDSGSGSAAEPFKSITRCVKEISNVSPGVDAFCLLANGTYRESVAMSTSGSVGWRIIEPWNVSSLPVWSGLEQLRELQWTRWNHPSQCVFKSSVGGSLPPFQQLFYKGRLQVEARWPNLDVEDIAGSALSRSSWQGTGPGSVYGQIRDPALARFNFSWDGALATLQVAHQFYTWTRRVQNHSGSSFQYTMDLPGLAGWDSRPDAEGWSHNQYFLSGVLGALDTQGEWWHDVDNNMLYFWPEDCVPPSDGEIEIKIHDVLLQHSGKSAEKLVVSGIRFVGGAASFTDCSNCIFDRLAFDFPSFNREVLEMNPPSTKGVTVGTHFNGSNCSFSSISLRYTNNHGLRILGENHVVNNTAVLHTDWLGTLTYVPLLLRGNGISARYCTVRYFGNAGVVTTIPNTPPSNPQLPPMPMEGRHLEIAYSHISHGGLIGKDTALLYTGGWDSAGLHWHHNWIHDGSEKCVRGDDQSRNMSVHHNVVFNCGMEPIVDVQSSGSGLGIIIKGNGHLVYHNTVLRANYSELCLPACVEPLKVFRKQYPLRKQNGNTSVFNNVARRDLGFPCSCHNASIHHPPGGNVSALFEGGLAAARIQNFSNFEFWPAEASPLVDAGVVFPPYTGSYVGSAPDIGAYERGSVYWTAGCSGLGPDLCRT